ncbi:hypothetical protein [Vibrio vulnificus]|uniref:hypothetical protein n=1 Tax=Vibrio vulnificus TaxID=672 RepID=UPI000B0AA7AB|nr:hypothetical protein [Vibrio vulnificus]EIE1224617.1 hypothetical protein [Vibrio vulnificus]EIE1228336.1 hypothetical protein [Vibrio vulnificus]EJC6733876.1 hypothetical protein [Vibrio vulnificus]EJS4043517.1 hypothetical protein [Vibrio vulnificus]
MPISSASFRVASRLGAEPKDGFFLSAKWLNGVQQAESLNRALALSTMAHFLAISG